MSRESKAGVYVVAAVISAAAALVLTVIQVTNPTFDNEITTPIDWANEIGATVMLAATLVAMWGMIKAGIAPRVGGLIFIAGFGLLLLGILPVYALGYSPDWFWFFGLSGLLLALVGITLCAVYSWRHRTLPRIIVVLLPFSILIGFGLAEFGGGIVHVIVWGAIALRLSQPAEQSAAAGAGA
jgi:hypothetical protein